MDNNKGSSNIKDDILNMVQSAIDTKDFAKLNDDITESVNRALDELRYKLRYKEPDRQGDLQNTPSASVNSTSAQHGSTQQGAGTGSQPPQSNVHIGFMSSQTIKYKPPVNAGINSGSKRPAPTVQNTPAAYNKNTQNNLPRVFVPHRQVGNVSGSASYALGILGTAGMAISSFVLFTVASAANASAVGSVGAGLFLSLPFWIALMLSGSVKRKRLVRFRAYLSRLQVRGFASITDLARSVGRSSNYVIRDLQKMLSLGMFPEGHFDQNYTCFIATNASYEQYRLAQDNYDNKVNNTPQNNTVVDESKRQNDRVNAVVRQGNEYIQKIREINDELPDEDISAKLDTLETTIKKIFQHIDEHPEQLSELDKFIQYYLPTTLKLITVYRDFDRQTIQGENISTAKKEILGTLDTINQAFIKLFDSLFQATAWDVSTDISVLETMLAQEGLTQSAFEIREENK